MSFIYTYEDLDGKDVSVGDICIRSIRYGNNSRLGWCRIEELGDSNNEVRIIGTDKSGKDINLKSGWSFSNRLLKV